MREAQVEEESGAETKGETTGDERRDERRRIEKGSGAGGERRRAEERGGQLSGRRGRETRSTPHRQPVEVVHAVGGGEAAGTDRGCPEQGGAPGLPGHRLGEVGAAHHAVRLVQWQ